MMHCIAIWVDSDQQLTIEFWFAIYGHWHQHKYLYFPYKAGDMFTAYQIFNDGYFSWVTIHVGVPTTATLHRIRDQRVLIYPNVFMHKYIDITLILKLKNWGLIV